MISWNGKSLLRKKIDIIIDLTTSRKGCSSTCQGVRTGGPWLLHVVETKMHINCLEMLAATPAVKTFMKDNNRMHALLRPDNTTVVVYVNNLGGTVSRDLVHLARDLWMWCLKK